jgi:Fe-S oxidoreductase
MAEVMAGAAASGGAEELAAESAKATQAAEAGARTGAEPVEASVESELVAAGVSGTESAPFSAINPGVDTLFFPGCSLVSYAPELTRRIGQWLSAAGFRWALSDACCGSPLMSAGLFERSRALRARLLEQIRAAGITRILTICPGCGEELAEVMGDEVSIVPLPEVIYQHFVEKNGPPLACNPPSDAPDATFEAAATLAGRTPDTTPDATAALTCSSPAGALGATHTTGNKTPSDATPATDAALISNTTNTAATSLTFFDSCHDRFDGRHGTAIRRLLALCFPQMPQLEMQHHGKDTLCCGAGGAVAAYDADITARRVWRVIDEARATGATTLVTACPTCTYTIAQALLNAPRERASILSAPASQVLALAAASDELNATAGAAQPTGAELATSGLNAASARLLSSHNYLELVFGQTINWPEVFGQLEAMWSGEYGPWLTGIFFS